jgi:hypothetical protein
MLANQCFNVSPSRDELVQQDEGPTLNADPSLTYSVGGGTGGVYGSPGGSGGLAWPGSVGAGMVGLLMVPSWAWVNWLRKLDHNSH